MSMIEYIKKSEVLEIIKSMPKDLIYEHIYDLKGIWIDDEDEWRIDKPPEEYESVLITHDVGKYSPILEVDSAYVVRTENDIVDFFDTGYGEMWYGTWGEKVKAWMPLPKPYEK